MNKTITKTAEIEKSEPACSRRAGRQLTSLSANACSVSGWQERKYMENEGNYSNNMCVGKHVWIWGGSDIHPPEGYLCTCGEMKYHIEICPVCGRLEICPVCGHLVVNPQPA